MTTALIFWFLAGLTALAFLVVVRRRKQMPVFLRLVLTVVAAAIVLYVGWTMVALFTGPIVP